MVLIFRIGLNDKWMKDTDLTVKDFLSLFRSIQLRYCISWKGSLISAADLIIKRMPR